MKRKIELLLQVAADFHDFCEPSMPSNAVCSGEELTENDLDLVAAAAQTPACIDKTLSDKT